MKEKYDAVNSVGYYLGCRWGDFVDYQQLHPDAGHHKENPQCRRRYCRDILAIECLRDYRFPPRDSYREVIDPG